MRRSSATDQPERPSADLPRDDEKIHDAGFRIASAGHHFTGLRSRSSSNFRLMPGPPSTVRLWVALVRAYPLRAPSPPSCRRLDTRIRPRATDVTTPTGSSTAAAVMITALGFIGITLLVSSSTSAPVLLVDSLIPPTAAIFNHRRPRIRLVSTWPHSAAEHDGSCEARE